MDLEEIINLSKRYKHLPNFEKVQKVLEALVYIERHEGSIVSEFSRGKRHIRTPNHLMFHLIGVKSKEAARNYLRSLIWDMKKSFEMMSKFEQREVLYETFFRDIRGSDTGCMEARLRPALNFADLCQKSGGVIPFDSLMKSFYEQFRQTGLNEDDTFACYHFLLDYFGQRVLRYYPVIGADGKTAPLTWGKIRVYCEEILFWDMSQWDAFEDNALLKIAYKSITGKARLVYVLF